MLSGTIGMYVHHLDVTGLESEPFAIVYKLTEYKIRRTDCLVLLSKPYITIWHFTLQMIATCPLLFPPFVRQKLKPPTKRLYVAHMIRLGPVMAVQTASVCRTIPRSDAGPI